jgi:hypothetical protein
MSKKTQNKGINTNKKLDIKKNRGKKEKQGKTK